MERLFSINIQHMFEFVKNKCSFLKKFSFQGNFFIFSASKKKMGLEGPEKDDVP